GLVAFASSLDQIGPFSKTVREAAQALEIMSGFDHYDSSSADANVDEIVKHLDMPIKQLRIGVPKEYFVGGLEPEVRAALESSLRLYEDLGCSVEQISLP